MLEGLAEAIPLSDCAVDAVTVADGFHWFRPEPALAEIRRVLEPGGGRVLLSTIPDWSGASWADGVGALVDAGETPPELDIHVSIGLTALL